jgi:hypothetical protein
MRLLDSSERPSTFGQLFGSENTHLVLPSEAPETELKAWIAFAVTWKRRYPDMKVIDDRNPDSIPANADLFILGWSNRLLNNPEFRIQGDSLQLKNEQVSIDGKIFTKPEHSLAIMGSSSSGRVGFIGAVSAESINTLVRKLPHYGSYSRLVFNAANGNNILKQTGKAENSILSRQLTDKKVELSLPARRKLTDQIKRNMD